MGFNFSKDKINKEDLQKIKELKLSIKDLEKLKQEFQSIDCNKDNSLSINEFLDAIGLYGLKDTLLIR